MNFKSEPSLWHLNHEAKLALIDKLFVKNKRQNFNFHLRMFNEDFSRVFRSINNHGDNFFEVSTSCNELMLKLISSTSSKYSRSSLDHKISKLVEEICQSLVWFDTAYYYCYDDPEQEEIILRQFASKGIIRLADIYIQWIPKRVEKHIDCEDTLHSREFHILNSEKIMRFKLSYYFKRMLSKQRRILNIIDKSDSASLLLNKLPTYENPNPPNYFDFQLWRKINERALYRASQSTGWSGRNNGSNLSDFFVCYRLLRFRRNQLLLRDMIIDQLNFQLTKLGKSYNPDFSVKISTTNNLPSVHDINELEDKLTREEVDFNEILNNVYRV